MGNLIQNGNFAATPNSTTNPTNLGFTTDAGYTYLASNGANSTGPGNYSIVTNPSVFQDGYYSYTAAPGNGSNNMLLVDGVLNSGVAFWKQTISTNLIANTTYTFSYYAATADQSSPAKIEVLVNGVAIDAGVQLGTTSAWQQIIETFKPSTSGAYTISMVDLNIAQVGNDFTIDNITLSAACYARGSRIATERGEIAIEALRVGDVALAASGRRPIVWLGHRRIDLARHPDPAAVRPVRVRAHAFGAGLPQRDLWLSPGHNIAFDGALMPISVLINARSVAQIDCDSVEYWHVELDAHDIVLAESLPAESYLDTGNRAAFVDGAAFVEAHPDFAPKHWRETCLPLVDSGPEVVAAKARLLACLADVGFRIDGHADVHIEADGARIEPIGLGGDRLLFVLPDAGARIALCSRAFVPAETLAESADRRELGICVAGVQIDGRALDLEDEAICASGWLAAEYAGARFSHRWTDGAARLPAGARIVIVDLAGHGAYGSVSHEAEARLLA